MLLGYPPLVQYADVVGVPVFSILTEAGGNLADALIVGFIIACLAVLGAWTRAYIKRMDERWVKHEDDMREWQDTVAQQFKAMNEHWEKQSNELRDDLESTLATLQMGMKEAFSQVAKVNDEHLSGIKELLRELKDGKAWSSEMELKFRLIDEKFKTIESRLCDGNDRFRDIEQQLRQQRGSQP